MKKMSLVITIGVITILIIIGVILSIGLLKHKSNDNYTDINEKNNVNINFKTYSSSKETDNIAIPFQTTNGYYVIDLVGEGIGNKMILDYENSSNVFKNDSISISHFYNISIGSVTINNLWGYKQIRISVNDNTGIPKTSNLGTYEVLENNGDYYLISSQTKGSTSKKYAIYITNSKQDYLFTIHADNSTNLEYVTKLYNLILNNSKVCFMEFDKEDNFKRATTEKNSNSDVDISNWRFFPDMILEYFISDGLIYSDSIKTYNFNHNSNSEIFMYQIYSLDDKLYQVGFTINKISKDDYEKVTIEENRKARHINNLYKDIKEIKLKAFDQVFVYTSSNKANLYVNIGDNYYTIDTGITYNSGSNNDELTEKLVTIMNQVFY